MSIVACVGSCNATQEPWRYRVTDKEPVLERASETVTPVTTELIGPEALKRFAGDQVALVLRYFTVRTPDRQAVVAGPGIPEKNLRAIELLNSWLGDESGYDEETWPVVREAIEENRLSERSRFRD